MCAVFTFSSQNSAKSGELSGGVTHAIASVLVHDFDKLSLSEQTEIVVSMHFYIRKAAHFTIFMTLGFFSFLTASTYKGSDKIKIPVVLLFCLLYASSDEIHQLFIPGRSGQFRDVCIDFCGSLTGTLAALLLTELIRRIIKKKSKR